MLEDYQKAFKALRRLEEEEESQASELETTVRKSKLSQNEIYSYSMSDSSDDIFIPKPPVLKMNAKKQPSPLKENVGSKEKEKCKCEAVTESKSKYLLSLFDLWYVNTKL